MSSIYPLDTNECYYNYSPHGNKNVNLKRAESSGNLDDLLEHLNKSRDNKINRESSTASETGVSDNNAALKGETPKTSKVN